MNTAQADKPLTATDRWKERLAAQGKPLVYLKTTSAVWYICGLESDEGAKLQVSYMAQSGKRPGNYKMKRETVMRKDVVCIKYYDNH